MAFVQENYFSSLPNKSYLRVRFVFSFYCRIDEKELKNDFIDFFSLQIFAYTMLTIGRVDCIEEFAPWVLTCSLAKSSLKKTNVLSYDESVAIVIEAAQSYFNMAFSYNDSNISLAE